MYVSHLSLRNVRLFQTLDLELPNDTTLIYGPNAAGKTSLLEALFYLATTRSPRLSNDHELVRWGTPGEAGVAPFARIVADVQRARAPLRLDVVVQLRGGEHAAPPAPTQHSPTSKLVRIDRTPARAIDLVGMLRVVLFTPSDLLLVAGAPSERRRYLDITLSQLDPRYMRTLSRYNRLVQQRNSMLRAWREQRRPLRAVEEELGFWDHELSTSAASLLAARLRLIDDLNLRAGPLYQSITGGSVPLHLGYQSSLTTSTTHEDSTPPIPHDASTLEQRITAALRARRRDEVQRGQTLVGIHRDDLLFRVDNADLGVYGSRGQQRSAALALKLAEAEVMQHRGGEPPVLLLDDMLSELDIQRRAHVLRALERTPQQTLLTTTDLGMLDSALLQRARRLRIEAGHIYEG